MTDTLSTQSGYMPPTLVSTNAYAIDSYEVGSSIPWHSLAGTVVVTAATDLWSDYYSSQTCLAESPPIGVFTVDIDDDGDYVVSDHDGVMFGLGRTLAAAWEDWLTSAIELRAQLAEDTASLHPRLRARLRFLDTLLQGT